MTMERQPMRIEADLLTVSQWLSPSFPIGAFGYSHGLEASVANGWVKTADDLQNWLHDILIHGTGRSDAIWMRLSFEAEDLDTLIALDEEARAFAPAHSRLQEAERQGAAFAQTVRAVWSLDIPDLLLPLAVAAAAQQRQLDIDLVVPLYLQAFASNLIAAAQRLMPLGQTEGQIILAGLQAPLLALVDTTKGADVEAIYSNAFISDIAAMQHESLEPRLFRS